MNNRIVKFLKQAVLALSAKPVYGLLTFALAVSAFIPGDAGGTTL